jgi:hypothetical protein
MVEPNLLVLVAEVVAAQEQVRRSAASTSSGYRQ